ncbi:MAG: hypothetical protein LBL09_00370 [Oscillospiraceae bacterium]|jgi:hypothetical protein|nr:hypothetical protein [Oscillospiraceae bacterium]
MNLELSKKQFRLLLDMIYIGNWVLNSTRGTDRITDYDEVESEVFSKCAENGMGALSENVNGAVRPSRAFSEGGIHEAIMDYEDTVFFEILAEELARRDMQTEGVGQEDVEELVKRVGEYTLEFEANGLENINIEI